MRILLLLVATISAAAVAGEDAPTSVICKANAKAWRDFSFLTEQWEGASSQPFAAATPARPRSGYPLREKLFSKLDTDAPVVRSITPRDGEAPELAEEFPATVLLRTQTWIFLSWSNDVNKVWLAVIDLEHKKATVSQTFRGVTSVGGELETLDCRQPPNSAQPTETAAPSWRVLQRVRFRRLSAGPLASAKAACDGLRSLGSPDSSTAMGECQSWRTGTIS